MRVRLWTPYEKLTYSRDVLDHLSQERELDPSVREIAMTLVRRRGDNPWHLSKASWETVKRANKSDGEYLRAVEMSELACEIEPDRGDFLNTLAVARHRVGEYRGALEAAMRSEEAFAGTPRAGEPSNLALMAIARYRLGSEDEALETLKLAQIRASENQAQGDYAVTQSLIRDGEALVGRTIPLDRED